MVDSAGGGGEVQETCAAVTVTEEQETQGGRGRDSLKATVDLPLLSQYHGELPFYLLFYFYFEMIFDVHNRCEGSPGSPLCPPSTLNLSYYHSAFIRTHQSNWYNVGN